MKQQFEDFAFPVFRYGNVMPVYDNGDDEIEQYDVRS
jgi:hypothetical protein